MGPKRDVVGELAGAMRQQDMRFMVALHHAENWWFFPHWRKEFDISDPRIGGESALMPQKRRSRTCSEPCQKSFTAL